MGLRERGAEAPATRRGGHPCGEQQEDEARGRRDDPGQQDAAGLCLGALHRGQQAQAPTRDTFSVGRPRGLRGEQRGGHWARVVPGQRAQAQDNVQEPVPLGSV